MTCRVPLRNDLCSIEMVFDGRPDQKEPNFGNFLGLFGIPPQGGRAWYAQNGDWGECETDEEAIKEIEDAWKR